MNARRRARTLGVARRPGSEEVLGRRRPVAGEGRCASPGCDEEPEGGRRFCAAHQALLDRVRAELEADVGARSPRRGKDRPGDHGSQF